MERSASFADVLEAADQLPLDDQEMLADVLHRRVVAQRRRRLVAKVREARAEYEAGRTREVTPEEIMTEILCET